MTEPPITRVPIDWDRIDDVLLDMDGTLLDRHFDDFFFEDALPTRYAAKYHLSFEDAQRKLIALYRSKKEQLEWADLHYWTRELSIDLVALHEEFAPLIRYHKDTETFFRFLRRTRKHASIVTNSHDEGLKIKIARTGLDHCVDRIVNAFEIGCLKRHQEFWSRVQPLLGFDPARTLYVDDDEACLEAARKHGIHHLVHRCTPNSQLEPRPSTQFLSIYSFEELVDGVDAPA